MRSTTNSTFELRRVPRAALALERARAHLLLLFDRSVQLLKVLVAQNLRLRPTIHHRILRDRPVKHRR